jgi:hypothetical protein
MTVTQQDIAHGFHLLKDGDAWCAVGPQFVDLMRSPAGFGDTVEGAVKALRAELRKAGWPDSAMPTLSSFTVHDTMTLSLPPEEILPAWRAAVLAYRQEYRVNPEDRFPRDAAFEAFRAALPDMPEEQAKVEANHAIAYAAANHTEWFWTGV